MSVDLERNDKQGQLAVGCGGVMAVVFLVAAIALWVTPTATSGAIGGGELGMPFTGVGAAFLSMAGFIIAYYGALALRRGRHHRASGPVLHGPPPPPHHRAPSR